jgi:hypothetical protein
MNLYQWKRDTTEENRRTQRQLDLLLFCPPKVHHRVVGDVSRSSMTGRQPTTWTGIYYEWSFCYEARCPRYKCYHRSTQLCTWHERFDVSLYCVLHLFIHISNTRYTKVDYGTYFTSRLTQMFGHTKMTSTADENNFTISYDTSL